MSKLILSLIGYGGSGKTSAARYLNETYGFATFTFSAVIREYAKTHGLELKSRPDFARTHAAIIQEYGPDYLPRMALDLPASRICIDDLRLRAYAEVFKRAGGQEIAFDCPVATRFARVQDHPDVAKYPHTLEAFIHNEVTDEEVVIAPGMQLEARALAQTADYHLDASGSLAHTLEQLDAIVKPLIGATPTTRR